MASHPSRRGLNFCRFLASDVEKITIFWESTLCEIIAFFRTRQNLCKTKFQKSYFFGEFSRMYFSSCFLFLVMFLHCDFWVVHDVRKIDVFSRGETIRCFLAPALSLRRRISYLSANRLEPRISRDQHIQTCQFKTTNVKIHPAVPKVYTHLISFGQMEMANASGNFGHTLVGLRAWNDAIHDFRRSVRKNCRTEKKKRFFRASEKMLFFRATATAPGWRSEKILIIWLAGYLAGWLSGWLAGYLAGWLSSWLAIWLTRWLRWLAGYLAIGFVAAWLAIWLLAIWLADWQIGIGYLAGSLNSSLSGLPSGYLDGWFAIWLAGYLAGWLGGGCSLAGWVALWLFGCLAGCLPGYLVGWLAGWLAGLLSGCLTGCLAGWWVGWPTGWLARWLADWVVAGRLIGGAGGWLFGWLAIWLFGWLFGWLAIWLVERLAGFRWLSGYLAG